MRNSKFSFANGLASITPERGVMDMLYAWVGCYNHGSTLQNHSITIIKTLRMAENLGLYEAKCIFDDVCDQVSKKMTTLHIRENTAQTAIDIFSWPIFVPPSSDIVISASKIRLVGEESQTFTVLKSIGKGHCISVPVILMAKAWVTDIIKRGDEINPQIVSQLTSYLGNQTYALSVIGAMKSDVDTEPFDMYFTADEQGKFMHMLNNNYTNGNYKLQIKELN